MKYEEDCERDERLQKSCLLGRYFGKYSKSYSRKNKKVGSPSHRKEAYQCNISVIIRKIKEENTKAKYLVWKKDREDIKIEGKIENEVKCDSCDKSLNMENCLVNHIKIFNAFHTAKETHSEIKGGYVRKEEVKSKYINDESFTNFELLRFSSICHFKNSNEKKYLPSCANSCDLCRKEITSSPNLISHQRPEHNVLQLEISTPKSDHNYSTCKKDFKDSTSFHQHLTGNQFGRQIGKDFYSVSPESQLKCQFCEAFDDFKNPEFSPQKGSEISKNKPKIFLSEYEPMTNIKVEEEEPEENLFSYKNSKPDFKPKYNSSNEPFHSFDANKSDLNILKIEFQDNHEEETFKGKNKELDDYEEDSEVKNEFVSILSTNKKSISSLHIENNHYLKEDQFNGNFNVHLDKDKNYFR